MSYVLGLDLGTSGLKGLLLNQAGQVVAEKTATYGLLTPKPGFSEQNPSEWVLAAEKVLTGLVNEVKDMAENLVGISFSGQMHSLVLLDQQMKPLRPAILWNDVRTTKQCQEIMEQAGDKVIAETKNIALEGFTFPKLLWVKEEEPEIWQQAATFVLPKDYLGYWLTDSIQMECSDAAGTLLLDVMKQEWDWSLAEEFDIPAAIFPKLVESTACIGTVKASLAATFGFKQEVKVFAGGADNACAAVGAGIVSQDKGMASIGTSGVFLSFEGQKEQNYQGKLHYFNHVIPNAYYSMGVTLAAGQSLNWFKQTFAPTESFESLLENINQIPAGSQGLLFTPYIMGERTPYVDSQIRGSFVGMDARHTRDYFARAVLEGITYSLRDAQEAMKKIAKREFSQIVSVGGGAKNPDWLQMQADIFNAEIVTLKVEQGPGIGAAMLAAVGVGWFETVEECVTAFIQYDQSYQPNKKAVAAYEGYYQLYTEIYGATKQLSHQLLKIQP